MEEFQTIQRAYDLFKSHNCVGSQNCIFLALKDNNHAGSKIGVAAGIGGIAGALVASQMGKKDAFQDVPYDGFLINRTEDGLALIPLNAQGVMWTASAEKLMAYPACYFIRNDQIESVKINNYALINTRVKSLKIKFTDGYTLYLMVTVKDKLISYNESNFEEFMSYYNKK